MTHACPSLPDLSSMTAAQLADLAKKPLACAHCGQELQLTCKPPKDGKPLVERIVVAPVRLELIGMIGAEPALRGLRDALEEIKELIHSRPRVEVHGTGGSPGPVEVALVDVVPPVRPKKASSKHHEPRTYKPRRCEGWMKRCGKMFTPTGPNAPYCNDCKARRKRAK